MRSTINHLYESLGKIASEKKLLEIFDPLIDQLNISSDNDDTVNQQIAELYDIFDNIIEFSDRIESPNINSLEEYQRYHNELVNFSKKIRKYPISQRVVVETKKIIEQFSDVNWSSETDEINELIRNAPDCKCGNPMVLRENSFNRSLFYGCSTFPICSNTVSIKR